MGLNEKIEVTVEGKCHQFNTVGETIVFVEECLKDGNGLTIEWVYIPTGETKKGYNNLIKQMKKI